MGQLIPTSWSSIGCAQGLAGITVSSGQAETCKAMTTLIIRKDVGGQADCTIRTRKEVMNNVMLLRPDEAVLTVGDSIF